MAKRAKASEPSEPEREAGRCHTDPGAPRLDGGGNPLLEIGEQRTGIHISHA